MRSAAGFLGLGLAVVAASTTTNYEAMLTGLWDQSDADQDGVLSSIEFVDANSRLGISPSAYTLHSSSFDVFFTDLDTDLSGGLTQSELAAAASNYPSYESILVRALTSNAVGIAWPASRQSCSSCRTRACARGLCTQRAVRTRVRQRQVNAFTSNAISMTDSELSTMLSVPDTLKQSQGTVSMAFSVAQPQIYSGTRLSIAQQLAATAGVTADDLILAFVAGTRRRHLSVTRSLQSAVPSSGTTIEATFFVRDDADADALTARLPTDVATLVAGVPALADFSITSVSAPESDVVPSDLPMTRMCPRLLNPNRAFVHCGVCTLCVAHRYVRPRRHPTLCARRARGQRLLLGQP
jgi:hypothetical protein